MKLVRIKCPGCGANLELNEDRTSAYCSYCGCKLYVDDANAQDAAYESRQRKKRQQALNQLDLFSAAVDREAEISGRLDRARQDLENAKNNLKRQQAARKRLYVIIIIAALVMLFGVIGSDNGIFLQIVQILLISAISAGVYRVGDRRNKAKILNAHQSFIDCSENIQSLAIELNNAKKETDVYSIPEKYRNAEAVEYFRKVISAGRAQNIPDAALLYEEYMQRQHLEQQLNLQNEQMADMQRTLSYTNNQLADLQREKHVADLKSKASKKKKPLNKGSDSKNDNRKAHDSETSPEKDDDILGTLVVAGGLLLTFSKIISKLDR